MTDEQSLALHELSRRHGIPSEAVFEIASWGYRIGARDMRERAASVAESKFARIHTYASENSDRYIAMRDAGQSIGDAVKRLPIEDEA